MNQKGKNNSNYRHGLSNTPVWVTYQNMMNRCHNSNRPDYRNYGGRGITVCDRWCSSFQNFYEDMGEKPTPKHTLERIDNDKGYSPENCKWATRFEQAANRRVTGQYPGVSRNRLGAWRARIKINQYEIHLGTFKLIEDAASIRKAAEEQLLGGGYF